MSATYTRSHIRTRSLLLPSCGRSGVVRCEKNGPRWLTGWLGGWIAGWPGGLAFGAKLVAFTPRGPKSAKKPLSVCTRAATANTVPQKKKQNVRREDARAILYIFLLLHRTTRTTVHGNDTRDSVGHTGCGGSAANTQPRPTTVSAATTNETANNKKNNNPLKHER